MMEYRGKLYAKIGKKFIELDKTTEDWAKLQTELKEAREMIATLNKELKQRIETDKNF